jgi:transposase
MDAIVECCAGLDVHKETVAACVTRLQRGKARRTVKTFGTMTCELHGLADWMGAQGVTHVAMESTGVLWKPVFNLLEGRFEALLCNARDLKQVPGRKTDVKDCVWIAQLLQHGLLRASFVPARGLRELRDLTRHRAQVVGEKTRVANRIHKTLQDANIKLASVATDILGVSGRGMLAALVSGETDADRMADLARRSLRGKIPRLRLALEGRVTSHHRFMLQILLEHLAYLEDTVDRLGARIREVMDRMDTEPPRGAGYGLPFETAVQLLETIPGVRRATAEVVVAEIGTDMTQYPSGKHLASWAGLCPGNNESAGRKRSGRTTKGNRWLRRALGQAAWAVSRSKKSYLGAHYRRVAARRGRKRAVVAVAHSLLVIIHGMLRDRREYEDLGSDFFDRLQPERLTRYYVRRLEALGHRVALDPAA